MKRDEIKRQVKSSIPIAVTSRTGKLMFPYRNLKTHKLIIENIVDLIENILSNEREGLGKHECESKFCMCPIPNLSMIDTNNEGYCIKCDKPWKAE
jgi:hypothetical protein